MAVDYDVALRGAKDYVTRMLCLVAKDPKANMMDLGGAVDQLNRAWDQLTDALCRQRDERDRVIRDLMNQLAEAKKPAGGG